jgi:hypothetical protein
MMWSLKHKYLYSEYDCSYGYYPRRQQNCTRYVRDVFSLAGDFENPEKTLLDFKNWDRDQPDNLSNMEFNIVMTLDTTCPNCKTRTWSVHESNGPDFVNDGAWNDVAESSLHHAMCEYTNENVKVFGSLDLLRAVSYRFCKADYNSSYGIRKETEPA